MTPVLSPRVQSIVDKLTRLFGWDFCISTAASSERPSHGEPKFFSWLHHARPNRLDHEFWGLGMYVIASRTKRPPVELPQR